MYTNDGVVFLKNHNKFQNDEISYVKITNELFVQNK